MCVRSIFCCCDDSRRPIFLSAFLSANVVERRNDEIHDIPSCTMMPNERRHSSTCRCTRTTWLKRLIRLYTKCKALGSCEHLDITVSHCFSVNEFKSPHTNINGVLVTDKQGLILASSGLLSRTRHRSIVRPSLCLDQNMKNDCSGPMASLSDLASTLFERSAIVCLENGEQ